MLRKHYITGVFTHAAFALATATLPTLFSTSAIAQNNIDEKIQVVVTANRVENSVDTVGSSLSVLTSEDIEKTGKNSVLEVLRAIPGVSIVQVGGRGKTASAFIRGGESDHTMVLIDGVRVNSGTVGSFDLSDLKTENIERIEILRGPQGVLYGSEAIGGVIQIITKSANDGLQLSASASTGSHSTQEYIAGVQYGDDDVKSSSSISFLDTDGFSVASEENGNVEDDAYDNVTVSTRNTLFFGDDGTIDMSALYTHSNSELDDFSFGIGPVDALDTESERDLITSSIKLRKPVSDSVIPTLEIALYDEDTKGTDPDTEFNNFTIDNQAVSATAQAELFLFNNASFVSGYTFEERHGKSLGNFDVKREVHSIFLDSLYELTEGVNVGIGGRYDDDSAFGGEATYRATISAMISPTARIHGSAGSGFKAPSFNELYFPNFGVETLDPETSRGYDLGIEKRFCGDAVVADLTLFYNEFDDLISFDSTTFLAANIAESEARGVEAQFSYDIAKWMGLSASYTYTDSEDKATGELLARRPRHSGSVQITSEPTEGLNLSLEYLLVRDRIDSDGSSLENYGRVDLAASYRATENIQPFLRVENLFDEDYEEVTGYGTPGLVAFAGVKVSG